MNWKRFNRGDCPVCNGARKDCRQNLSTGLVHCRDSEANPIDYLWRGSDTWGFGLWAYKLDVEQQNQDNRDEWRRQREQEKQQRLKAEADRLAQSLSQPERDREIRKLLEQLSLSQAHREDLSRRGLTDELIAAGMFRSVEQWQKLDTEVSYRLAGVSLDGRSLITQPGYLCPVWNVDGLIVGWQLRSDSSDTGKYKWASSVTQKRPHGTTSHLKETGELPLTVCRSGGKQEQSLIPNPLDNQGLSKHPAQVRGIGIVEGILKPWIAAQLSGQVFVGAAGGNFPASQQQFKEILAQLSEELGTSNVQIYPDSGAVVNSPVYQLTCRTITLIQSWGYSVTVADWGQFYDKTQPDYDEWLAEGGVGEIRFITAAEFLELRQDRLRDWLQKVEQQLKTIRAKTRKRLKAWGFSKQSQKKSLEELRNLHAEPESKDQKQSSSQHPQYYLAGHRRETWISTGKWTFDSSGTGTGKSFDTGTLLPEDFEAQRAFYITADPRNPSTPTLKNWGYLDGRHSGLIEDEHGKLRRVKKGEPYSVPPNCFRTATIAALREAGISGADDSELVCQTCPWFEACQGGHVYGYLANRRAALAEESRIRSHPASLPTVDEFKDYGDSVLIWEEWETILTATREINVYRHDLEKLIAHLLLEAPAIFSQLHPLLTALSRLTQAKQPTRYGWNHQALVKELPDLSDDLDLEAIAGATEPNLTPILDPFREYGTSMAELPAGVRKKFAESDEATSTKARELLKQWLIPLLNVLTGKVGYLSLSSGILRITIPDQDLVKIAHAAKKNIFLDATGHREELALLLGIDLAEIDWVAQEPSPGADLKIIQVAGMGRLGQQRGNYQRQQVEAILKKLLTQHPEAGVIRFKKYTLKSDGIQNVNYRWFIESRGVNDAEGLETLILDGVPCPNLESLAAQFTCIYGRIPNEGTQKLSYPLQITNPLPEGIQPHLEMEASADPDFRDFVYRRILANIDQGIGRLRANRRSADEQLTVYLLGDFPLSVPVELVKAIDITLEAASKLEKFELALKEAIAELKATGEKITQQALAKMTGYSQGYISRFRELLQTLLDDFSNKSNNPESAAGEAQWLGREYLPLASPQQLSWEIFTVTEAFPKKSWLTIWESAPPPTQIDILKRLIFALPPEALVSLWSTE
jgi:hypothetical protein